MTPTEFADLGIFSPASNHWIITIPMIILTAIACGAVLRLVIARRVQLIPIAVAASVVGSGSMIYGFAVVDELIFISAIVGGVFLWLKAKRVRPVFPTGTLERLHLIVFLILISYMLVMSLLGIIELSSPRKLRWVVFFGSLGAFASLTFIPNSRVADGRLWLRFTASASVIYFGAYLAHGLFTELFRSQTRYSVQTSEWGATAYSSSPTLLAVSLGVLAVTSGDRVTKLTGLAAMVLAVIASLYFDSRTGILLVALGILFTLPIISRRAGTAFVVATSVLLVIAVTVGLGSKFDDSTIGYAIYEVKTSASALWDPDSSRDRNRAIHLQIAAEHASGKYGTAAAIFGQGYRMHGYVIAPRYIELQEYYGDSRAEIDARFVDKFGLISTEGVTALLVDTGVIGFSLLVISLGLSAAVAARGAPVRAWPSLASFMLGVLLVLATANVLDQTLIWLFAAPNTLMMGLRGVINASQIRRL